MSELLDVVVALYEHLEGRHPSPCVNISENCAFCDVITKAGLKDVLNKYHPMYRRI